MVATYSIEIGREHARFSRLLLCSPWYGRLFPNAALGSCNGDHLRTIAGGERFTVTVQGTVTGFAADVILIDDLLTTSDALAGRTAARPRFIGNSL